VGAGVLAGALTAGTLLAVSVPPSEAAPAPQAAAPDAAQWVQKWAPEANKDGLGAFEGVENRGSTKEIYVQDNNYRFDMNVKDRDGSDRQRNEVKGMVTGGKNLIISKGQTWRFTYSMYIPGSLKATTSFTHIMQMKEPGEGTGPILTIDLRKRGSQNRLELVIFDSDTVVGSTDLNPLQNKWINVDVQIKFDDKPNGTARFIVTDGSTTVLDASKSNVDTWLADRARPKWGIYRSIKDKADLENTYLLITGMRAYQWQ
jgi:chitin-binding protein